jgi:hypothetical protein
MQRRIFVKGTVGLLAGGAKALEARASASVTIERVSYKGWEDAYRLSNGTVEVVVVPAVARVMRYAYVGGPNLLWENPTVAGKRIPLNTWPGGGGTGGDKIWPWSQDDWPALIGRGFPAPPGADQATHQAQIVGPDTLRLTSPPVVPWGIRIVRDIRLAPTGTEVFFANRFIKYRTGAPYPVGVWTITQVPVNGPVWARLTPSSTLPDSYRMMGDAPFASVAKVGQGSALLRVQRDRKAMSKIGIDGDLLATRAGDTLFTVRIAAPPPADNTAAAYQPGERLQVFVMPDNDSDRAKGITPYYELELTSPRKILDKDGTLTLPVVWSLGRLPADRQNDQGVIAALSEASR